MAGETKEVDITMLQSVETKAGDTTSSGLYSSAGRYSSDSETNKYDDEAYLLPMYLPKLESGRGLGKCVVQCQHQQQQLPLYSDPLLAS